MTKRISSLVLGLLLLALPVEAQQLLQFGQVVTSIDDNSGGAGTNGTSYAIPAQDTSAITWTVKFATAPSAVSIILQGSLNNSDWYTLDTSTSTAGEIRVVATSAVFIRARISSKTGGGNTTVQIVLKDGSVAVLGTGNAPCLNCNNTWTGSNTFTQPVLFADGSAASPSISFLNDTDKGLYSITSGWFGWSGSGSVSGALGSGGIRLLETNSLGWSSNPGISNPDLLLVRDAANILALRNSTNGQAFRIYNTYTSEASHLGWQLDANTAGSFLLRYRNNGVLSTAATLSSAGLLTLPSTGMVVGSNSLVLSANNLTGAAGGQFQTSIFTAYATGSFQWVNQTRLLSSINGNLRVVNSDSSNTYDITLADWGTTLIAESITLTDTQVLTGPTSGVGTVTTNIITVDNVVCEFEMTGTSAPLLVKTGGGLCTVTKDNAGTLNFYYDSGYKWQNLRGGSRNIRNYFES
jgi:hypothetical protein